MDSDRAPESDVPQGEATIEYLVATTLADQVVAYQKRLKEKGIDPGLRFQLVADFAHLLGTSLIEQASRPKFYCGTNKDIDPQQVADFINQGFGRQVKSR